MKLKNSILAAAVLGCMPVAANAAFFAIGTSASDAPTSNAAITAAPGDTVTLHLWARSTGSGYLNAFSFRIEGSGQALTATTGGFSFNDAVVLPAGTPKNAPAAAGSAVGNGMSYQLYNTFGHGAAGADTGLRATMTRIASFTVTIPANAASGSSSNLFLVQSAAITESSSLATRHAVGFASSGASALYLGGVTTGATLPGVDGNIINTAGTTVNNTAGFAYPTGAGNRTTTADAIITVQAVQTGPSLDITSGLTGVSGSVSVAGSAAAGYALTPIANPAAVAGSYNVTFGGGAPGSVIVGINLGGTNAAATAATLGLSPVAGSPALAGVLAGYTYFYSEPSLGGSTFTFSYDLGSTGTTVTGLAVIPEPTSAAILGLAGLPLLSRRSRRA